MKPETTHFLEVARNSLARGMRMLEADLPEDAGRAAYLAAYLAAFHAAQALIYERENRSLKTHQGVQSEFSRLIRDDPLMPADLRGFLRRAYAFKTVADYEPLSGVPPSPDEARAALDTAGRFVEDIVRIIGQTTTD